MTTTEAPRLLADNGPCAVGSPTQVLDAAPLSRAGKELVTADANGAILMRRLLDAGLDIDAVRLLPYLMPIRQAIWWGCMCSWHSVGGSPNEREDEALRAAVTWVRLPAEAEWQVARQAANADGCDSAGGCCAEAISWTGFWTPTEKWKHRDVNVAARLIAGAALTAVGRLKHANAPRRLLQLSVEIARGIHPWDGMPSR